METISQHLTKCVDKLFMQYKQTLETGTLEEESLSLKMLIIYYENVLTHTKFEKVAFYFKNKLKTINLLMYKKYFNDD